MQAAAAPRRAALCKPTYRYPVNELPPLYTPAGHTAIAHARNVNVGTGIGERESEPRDPEEKPRILR